MRTTLTLDSDVAILLEREVAERNSSLKQVVNEAIRLGLAAKAKGAKKQKVVMPKPLDLGKAKVPNFDNVAEILELIEDDPR